MYACFIRKPDSCCANTCARNVVGIAFRKQIAHHVLHHQPDNYWTGPRVPAPTSACSVRRSINGQGQMGVRRILGVLSLAKRFGPVRVEAACTEALALGVREYHFVKRYLERQPELPLTLQQVDPLIRELQQYRDVIQLRLKESEAT